MPRIRTIKPETWTSENLGGRSAVARLTFLGLISLADDDGRGKGDADIVRGALHARASDIDTAATAAALHELAVPDPDGRPPLIGLYRERGSTYYVVLGWGEHQRVDRPTPSRIPEPPPEVVEAGEKCKSADFRGGIITSRESSRGLANPRESSRLTRTVDQDLGPGPTTSADGAAQGALCSSRKKNNGDHSSAFQVFMDGIVTDYLGGKPGSTERTDREMVTALYRRFGRDGRDILAMAEGDPVKARAAVDAIGRWLAGCGRSWSLSTCVKWVRDYLADPEGFGKETKT